MSTQVIQPDGWKLPRGYSNGVLSPAGARLLTIAGQIAWDGDQRLVGRGDFAAQFRQALANVVTIVRAAGGEPQNLTQLTIFVTDKQKYLASTHQLAGLWRELVGQHYPAMALVEVKKLLEDGALVEIQALAAISPN
jgi:enamine deaminase RidA (YjgF/YER057c/UK114 family)